MLKKVGLYLLIVLGPIALGFIRALSNTPSRR